MGSDAQDDGATSSCSRSTRSRNGGFGGTGLGKGTFTHARTATQLIPYVNTDFIYSALAQELGLIGVSALLLVYMLFVARGLRIALLADDGFSKLLAAGLTFGFALQTFIIVGGVLRLIPLTGITLPFVSLRRLERRRELRPARRAAALSNRANAQRGEAMNKQIRASPSPRSCSSRADRRHDVLADLGRRPASPTARTTRSSASRSSRSSAGKIYAGDGRDGCSRRTSKRKVGGQTLYFRTYPQRGFAPHVVGYSTQSRSRAGLERSMNDYLTGVEQRTSTRRSTRRSTSCRARRSRATTSC